MSFYRNEVIDNNRLNRISSICEIGFQVGASSLTFLTALKRSLKYYGFDYGLIHAKQYIISKYFDMNMTWGKSEYTVPKFRNIVCNDIHIEAY